MVNEKHYELGTKRRLSQTLCRAASCGPRSRVRDTGREAEASLRTPKGSDGWQNGRIPRHLCTCAEVGFEVVEGEWEMGAGGVNG